MSINGGLTTSAKKRAEKYSYGHTGSKELLYRLCQEDYYGEKLIDIIVQIGLVGPRIENLFNAVGRDDRKFVGYIVIFRDADIKEKIVSASLADFFNLVSKYESTFIRRYGK